MLVLVSSKKSFNSQPLKNSPIHHAKRIHSQNNKSDLFIAGNFMHLRQLAANPVSILSKNFHWLLAFIYSEQACWHETHAWAQEYVLFFSVPQVSVHKKKWEGFGYWFRQVVKYWRIFSLVTFTTDHFYNQFDIKADFQENSAFLLDIFLPYFVPMTARKPSFMRVHI